MNIRELSREYAPYIIDLRREFHQYPEIAWKEQHTARRIERELDRMGIPYRRITDRGVVAIVEGAQKDDIVALRADMDALKVTEMTALPYASEHDGVMHACGHDGHMAMLLGAARILKKMQHELPGTVMLIFQPAEETTEGAKRLIEEGVMEGVKGIFAIHLWSELPSGMISLEEGPRMAASDVFTVRIAGKGGHGALPHCCVDSVVAGSAMVMNLQSVVSRMVNPLEPAVVTVGAFNAGTAFNVIAGEALLQGTARFYDAHTGAVVKESIQRIVEDTAHSYGAKAEIDYRHAIDPVVNDRRCSEIAYGAARGLGLEQHIATMEKVTAGEDFSEYQKHAPGIMVFLGIRNEGKGVLFPHHHAMFMIDEDVLEIGAALYAKFALDFLLCKE